MAVALAYPIVRPHNFVRIAQVLKPRGSKFAKNHQDNGDWVFKERTFTEFANPPEARRSTAGRGNGLGTASLDICTQEPTSP